MDQSPAAAAQQLAVNQWELILAAKTGDTEAVVDLLDRGVPIDTKDDKGKSLMHWAALGGHVTTMRLLNRRGCIVDSVDGERLTPLYSAAAMGQTKAVRELLRKGAQKSVVVGRFGTPLHQAAINGHKETVVAMLEEGCPIDVVDNDLATALHWVAEGGHVEVVRELVGRGCNVNAEEANGCTPLHSAAGYGRTQVVSELVSLGAVKSVVAGMCGTPLHQAIAKELIETIEALLENKVYEGDFTKQDDSAWNAQMLDNNAIGTCNSLGQTPVMWAVRRGQMEAIKMLITKGGTVTDRDSHSWLTFEHCFVGGHASKLSQFCEACGIRSNGEGLKGALAALISQGLVDGSKVLCLCAISGDSVFLEDQFSKLVTSDACIMPAAVKCAKYYFNRGVQFINQLTIPDENALNPLHVSLISMKCFRMEFVGTSVTCGTKDHNSFITKLLSHPILKATVNEHFPNGLSPLDLARQFDLPDIAAKIEGAGGRPGVWADIPQEIEVQHHTGLLQFKEAYASIKAIAESGEQGLEAINSVFLSILGGHVVHAADDSQLVKEQVLGQHPDLGDVVTHVLPHIQVRHWKRVGLALGMKAHSMLSVNNTLTTTIGIWRP